jgi:hypothetical protein
VLKDEADVAPIRRHASDIATVDLDLAGLLLEQAPNKTEQSRLA